MYVYRAANTVASLFIRLMEKKRERGFFGGESGSEDEEGCYLHLLVQYFSKSQASLGIMGVTGTDGGGHSSASTSRTCWDLSYCVDFSARLQVTSKAIPIVENM